MVSTINKSGMSGPVDRGADVGDTAGDAGRGLVMDDHHRLDRVCGILCKPGLDLGGVGAATPIAGNEIDLDAEAAPPSGATGSRKWPVSTIRTLSPGDSVLTIAASQAPVPDDGKIITGPAVWKILWLPSSTARPSSANWALR